MGDSARQRGGSRCEARVVSNRGLVRAVIGKVRERISEKHIHVVNIYLTERGPDVRPRPP